MGAATPCLRRDYYAALPSPFTTMPLLCLSRRRLKLSTAAEISRRLRKERRKNEGPASLTPSRCLLPSITYISYYRHEAAAEVPRCRRHPMLRPDASATVKVDKREAENGMEKRKIEECLSCWCFWKERQ
nr:hypothetical protein Itr_chr06CG12720 [Ipomoea trifida]GME07693.1 hypothetical protein Iba_scaffold6462CG0040 [Ipomoea batatas]